MDLACDLGHEFPRSNILSHHQKFERGWILWMVEYFVDIIWCTFCFYHILQCHPGVTFLLLETYAWSYSYYNGDGVYFRTWYMLDTSACLHFNYVLTDVINSIIIYKIFVFLSPEIMQISYTIGADTEWNPRTEGTHHNHTIWPWVEMEYCR